MTEMRDPTIPPDPFDRAEEVVKGTARAAVEVASVLIGTHEERSRAREARATLDAAEAAQRAAEAAQQAAEAAAEDDDAFGF